MKTIFSLLVFLLFAIVGMWWYFSCDWCTDTSPSVENIPVVVPDPDPLPEKIPENGLFATDITDNTKIFTYPKNLLIFKDADSIYIPESLQNVSIKVADFLNQEQNMELNVFGYETYQERSDSLMLGIKRAERFKQFLVSNGINGDRIRTQAKLYDFTYDLKDKYEGGLVLEFDNIDENNLEIIEKGIANKILYADFGSKQFKADAALQNYAFELKNFLTKYPNKSVTIIGHTDDVGSTASNFSFGQNRAENVKRYLISQGIPSNKLNASSKGESEPVVPNDSEANRAKNRRIEIIVN